MNHGHNSEEKTAHCMCPYCQEDLGPEIPPYCVPCGVALRYCETCHTVAVREATVCPTCGGKLTWTHERTP
jgi:hypothetical protein